MIIGTNGVKPVKWIWVNWKMRAIKVIIIEIIWIKFSFSFKKIRPNKILTKGEIKYPKLASVRWLFKIDQMKVIQLDEIRRAVNASFINLRGEERF